MVEGVELNVSDESKEKLRCFVCGGYLTCSPIRILPDGSNICGRCSPANKATTYRNFALEAILKDAVFPCKFKIKGCLKQINFISDSDHESTCTYSTKTSSTLIEPTETVVNNTNMDTLIKSSGSTCAQEEFPTCSSKDENIFAVPKPGNAVLGKASMCTDDFEGGSNWHENSERNTSAPPSTADSTNNFNTHRGRASSVASNRSQRLHWNGRQSHHSRPRPYYNFVENRNQWRNPWLNDRPPENINMYKRRNNLIIVKGGTFYVNW